MHPTMGKAVVVAIGLACFVSPGRAEEEGKKPCGCCAAQAAAEFQQTEGSGDSYSPRQLAAAYAATLPRFEHPNKKIYYVVEGDLIVSEDELFDYAADWVRNKQFYEQAKTEYTKSLKSFDINDNRYADALDYGLRAKLVLHLRPDGREDFWPDPADPNKQRDFSTNPLKFCVLKQEFVKHFGGEKEYRLTVADMLAVTGAKKKLDIEPTPDEEAWSDICGVRFEHVAALDETDPASLPSDGSPPPGVDFTVRPTRVASFVAAAFFPGDDPSEKHVLIGPSYFELWESKEQGSPDINPTGVMRHEIGHVLAFRHEHIRPEAPWVCPNESLTTAKPLGDYDPNSVMHYICGGAGTTHLQFSNDDRRWSLDKYGPSLGGRSYSGKISQAASPILQFGKTSFVRADTNKDAATDAAAIVKELRLRELKQEQSKNSLLKLFGTGNARNELLRGAWNEFGQPSATRLDTMLSNSRFLGKSSFALYDDYKKSIYGSGIGGDNRDELYTLKLRLPGIEKTSPQRVKYENALAQSRAVGCLMVRGIHINEMDDAGHTGKSRIRWGNFYECEHGPLCTSERFYGQPRAGYGTGFLVSPTLMVTAGHCVDELSENRIQLNNVRVVFDFEYGLDGTEPAKTISNGSVYRIRNVLDWRNDDEQDWAVCELDRAVEGIEPLKIRRTEKLPDDAELYCLGHPCGLPKKYVDNGIIFDNATEPWFVCSLDTYGGNSGSPVINVATHTVEGILVRGAEDFQLDELLRLGPDRCYVSIKYGDSGELPPGLLPGESGSRAGERVTRTTVFASLVPE